MSISRKGQSLVEFSLVLPIAVLLMTVFLDLGRATFAYISISNAVREGTRYAVVHESQTTAQKDAIKEQITGQMQGIDLSKVTMSITPPTPTNANITITVNYSFNPVTPGLKAILGNGNDLPLNVVSTMRVAPVVMPQE